jgi:hypothetical protein
MGMNNSSKQLEHFKHHLNKLFIEELGEVLDPEIFVNKP